MLLGPLGLQERGPESVQLSGIRAPRLPNAAERLLVGFSAAAGLGGVEAQAAVLVARVEVDVIDLADGQSPQLVGRDGPGFVDEDGQDLAERQAAPPVAVPAVAGGFAFGSAVSSISLTIRSADFVSFQISSTNAAVIVGCSAWSM